MAAAGEKTKQDGQQNSHTVQSSTEERDGDGLVSSPLCKREELQNSTFSCELSSYILFWWHVKHHWLLTDWLHERTQECLSVCLYGAQQQTLTTISR